MYGHTNIKQAGDLQRDTEARVDRTYGTQLWGCMKPSNIAVIQRFQNKALRNIVGVPWYVRNADLNSDLHIRGVSKMFGEWYQKTNKTKDTNKLTLLAFKIIAILHNTLLATFIKLLETVSKGLFRTRSKNRCHTFLHYSHVCKTCAFRRGNRKKSNVHP
jgi:hypothetical protein